MKIKKWILPKPIEIEEIYNCNLSSTLQKVLARRGINLESDLEELLSHPVLPKAEEHFNDVENTTKRILEACDSNEKIAICGDYDADGITSTILLCELLSKLGAKPIPFIPSRLNDGYGLNLKIIDEVYKHKISLLITVDNGISAFQAIKRANEIGIDLIITDHHKIPMFVEDIYALIHPETSPKNSPYKYLAGVGIAYMLAQNICEKTKFDISKTAANELFCIGTIADMAPLIGANRKWLKENLPIITRTSNIGIKAIINKLKIRHSDISTEDIGYKIAPFINAVGRIGDPKLIMDLLSSKSQKNVNEMIKECLIINDKRKKMTSLIEAEAIEIAKNEVKHNNKFLVICKRDWHTGIIGIVAARLVDKFNLPTAIIAEANDGLFRGSIRSNNLLKVNQALNECKNILISHGGHSAAGGFTIKKENINLLKDALNLYAINSFKDIDLDKFIKPEAHLKISEINVSFYDQLRLIGPFGISNPQPIFWTRKCIIRQIYHLKGNHIKMKLDDGNEIIDAIKWNNTNTLKIKEIIDVAYTIEINRWNKKEKLQLNIIDIKPYKEKIDLKLNNRIYKCQLKNESDIIVTNKDGHCFSSDFHEYIFPSNNKEEVFAKKILSFAEIALGKTS